MNFTVALLNLLLWHNVTVETATCSQPLLSHTGCVTTAFQKKILREIQLSSVCLLVRSLCYIMLRKGDHISLPLLSCTSYGNLIGEFD